jgi:hypothetical protein
LSIGVQLCYPFRVKNHVNKGNSPVESTGWAFER